MAPRGRSRRQSREDNRDEQPGGAGPDAQAAPVPPEGEDLHHLNREWHIAGALLQIRLDPRWNIPPPDIPAAAAHERDDLVMPGDEPAPRRRGAPEPRPRQAALARGKLTRRDQRRRARMLVAGAAVHLDEERAEEQQEYDRQDETGHDQYGEGVHDHHSDEAVQQDGLDDQPGVHETGQHAGDAADPRISPSTMISFSPLLQPEFQPHSQEQTRLDELFHMNACPTDEFTSIAESFRMSRAQHFYQGASSSHPPAPLPPASHETTHHVPWVPTYSSPPVIGYPVFDPTRIGSESAERGPPPAADPQPPSPSRRPRREIRPRQCGTGGHIQPQDGRQQD
ncbi:hypothetical protein PIB30_001592 [Stylosanthes scabra]|uniref:Uncharacterized protein n=1 Tax=Stylosanthes scabra TaxID=79078 RepID=A0ABU6S395_9FABA|nr:hypothetical protein [Stylosanthes scabra]